MAKTTKQLLVGTDEWRAAMIKTHLEGLDTGPETPTSQAEKASCDLNNILKQALSGQITLDRQMPVYADVSNVGDFREARERIRLFGEYFDTLPAETREIFQNDPANLAEALADPNQHRDLAQLGLFPDDAPGATPPTPPAPPSGSQTTATPPPPQG